MALKTLGDWFALLGCAVLAYFISVLVGARNLKSIVILFLVVVAIFEFSAYMERRKRRRKRKRLPTRKQPTSEVEQGQPNLRKIKRNLKKKKGER